MSSRNKLRSVGRVVCMAEDPRAAERCATNPSEGVSDAASLFRQMALAREIQGTSSRPSATDGDAAIGTDSFPC